MCDHYQGLSWLAVYFDQKVGDHLRVYAIKLAGRFVCEEKRRVVRKGSGYGDPLLFSATEFVGLVIVSVGEAYNAKEFLGSGRAGPARGPSGHHWKLDVFGRWQGGN